MKIASWNVNSINVRSTQLYDWLKQYQPEVIGLQELKCERQQFPMALMEQLGYKVIVNGQKTYNGVALLSRFDLENVEYDIPDFPDEQKRVISATVAGIRIINVYVPNGQTPESDKYLYKLNWLEALTVYLKREIEKYDKLVIMGDFNIAPNDEDVHDPKVWKDQVLCTTKERMAFDRLLSLGLIDGFRLFAQPVALFSWWDYRQQKFEHNEGVRIDHILVSKTVSSQMVESVIHKEIRANDRPSDHAPVSITITI